MTLPRNTILLFFVLISLSGCTEGSDHKSKDQRLTTTNDFEKFDPQLLQFLFVYANEIDRNFFDKEWLYYNIYFFEIGNERFFTIWTFTAFPNKNLFKENVKKDCLGCLYKLNRRKIVIISDPELDFSSCFSFSDNCVTNASIEAEKDYDGPIYDGEHFYQTYRILGKGDEIQFLQNDSVVSPFDIR